MVENSHDKEEWLRQLRQRVGESDKSKGVALVLAIFLGWLGADRFYLGYAWIGLLKFFTLGGGGFLWAIDVIWLLLDCLPDAEGGTLKPIDFP